MSDGTPNPGDLPLTKLHDLCRRSSSTGEISMLPLALILNRLKFWGVVYKHLGYVDGRTGLLLG
jgi:hypothetical protein